MASKKLTTEIGSSGVYIAGGTISGEEYNRDLIGRRAIDAYDQMRRNDATVNAALDAVKQPVLNADYEVDPASDDKADIEVAETVNECLFNVLNWDKFLEEALTYLDFGFSVFEIVMAPQVMNGKLRIALAKLGYRKQTTIQYWETADKQPGIQQYLSNGDHFSIPLEKLVIFTRKQEGDNHEGISILRPAYKHWKIKDQLYKIDAVGHENHALGILDITQPKGASATDKAKMQEFAMNRRANALSHIIKPEGWTAEFMDMKSHTLRDIMPSVQHHDRQIMKNVLAQFIELGAQGGSGSRSTSEDHSRLFELAVQRVADQVVQVLQQTVVRLIVDLNFTGRSYPTLRVSNISDDNIPVLSEAVGKFVTAGALHPRASDENTIRKMIGWTEVEEDELDPLFDTAKPADDEDVTPLQAARQLHASLEKQLYEPPRAA